MYALGDLYLVHGPLMDYIPGISGYQFMLWETVTDMQLQLTLLSFTIQTLDKFYECFLK